MAEFDKKKFLVLHPSQNLSKVLKKANQLNAKNGPFESIIFVGAVKANDDLDVPSLTIDVPTLFTQNTPDSDIANLKSTVNLKCLGKCGLYKLACGITVGYISQAKDIEESFIRSSFENKKVDILISFHWPSKIGKQQKLSLVNDAKIDILVNLVKPRYHFAVGSLSGRFFESNPFKWEDGTVTRFISLAQEGNAEKEKWAYAFNLSLKQTTDDPDNLIDNPFLVKDIVVSNSRESAGLSRMGRKFEDNSNSDNSSALKKRKIVMPDKCFFCLSNPNLETHMIISIGNHCYLTVAKGPLTRPRDNLLFSGHAIIIPIAHIPTPRSSSELESSNDVLKTPLVREIMRYQISLIKMFRDQFNSSLCFFEINQSTSVHYHIQLFPVLTELLENFEYLLRKQAKTNNEKFTRNQQIDFQKFDSKSAEEMEKLNIIRNNSDHILFTIAHSVEQQVYYICELKDDSSGIDLQFPRRVFAHVLKSPKRIYWDKCKQSQQRESKECELFKEAFKDYDFTIETD